MTTADEQAPGRALVAAGSPVAGSMTGAAAALVFEAGSGAVQLDAQLAACLRAAAEEAAAVAVPRERVRAGADDRLDDLARGGHVRNVQDH